MEDEDAPGAGEVVREDEGRDSLRKLSANNQGVNESASKHETRPWL